MAATEEHMLSKVRALLAKAESTEFEAEAEALTAKAQDLMARYSLNLAMVEAGAGMTGDPTSRPIVLEAPYVDTKALLISSVAVANRCRTVWMTTPPHAVVFGFPADIDAVELLYTSLLIQAAQAIQAAGSVRDHVGRSRTRSFRRSFLIGFASRVGERLREASAATTEEVESELGVSLLPVLADRSAQIDRLVDATFPRATTTSFRHSNGHGYLAGRVAADLASIDTRHAVSTSRARLQP